VATGLGLEVEDDTHAGGRREVEQRVGLEGESGGGKVGGSEGPTEADVTRGDRVEGRERRRGTGRWERRVIRAVRLRISVWCWLSGTAK
jgi:hypothetical protein